MLFFFYYYFFPLRLMTHYKKVTQKGMHAQICQQKNPSHFTTDAAADSLDSLPERLKVGQCIHLQAGFLLLMEPTGKAYRQQDCKWKVTIYSQVVVLSL